MTDFAHLGFRVDSSQLKQGETALKGVERQSVKTAAAAKGVEAGFRKSSAAARTFSQRSSVSGAHVANLTAQMNDIGVMLAAGQSPLLLATQQGTQITQVFQQMNTTGTGTLRALGSAFMAMISPVSLVTIGVIAGGAALAQWGIRAITAGRDTRDLSDIIDEVNDSFGAMKSAIELATKPLEDLIERFGDGTEAVIEWQTQLAKLERIETLSAARSALAGIAEETKDANASTGIWTASFNMQLGMMEPMLERLDTSLADIAARADTVGSSTEGMLGLYEEMHTAVVALQGPMEDWTDEQREAFRPLLETLTVLQEMVQAEKMLGEAAEETAGQTAKQLADAEKLLENLKRRREIAEVNMKFGRESAQASELQRRHERETLTQQAQRLGVSERTAAIMQMELTAAQAMESAERHRKRQKELQAELDEDALRRAEAQAKLEERRRLFMDSTNMIMQGQIAIAEASLLYGRDSIQVRELELDLATKLYEAELDRLEITGSHKREMIGQYRSLQRYNLALKQQQPIIRAQLRTVNSIAKAWSDWITDGAKDFKTFTNQIRQTFKKLLADMLTTMLKNQILIPLGIASGLLSGAAANAMMGGTFVPGSGMAGSLLTAGAGGAGSALGLGLAGGAAGGWLSGLFGSFGGTGMLAGAPVTVAGTGLLGGLGASLGGGLGGMFNVGANAALAGGGIGATLGALVPPLAITALVAAIVSKISAFDKGGGIVRRSVDLEFSREGLAARRIGHWENKRILGSDRHGIVDEGELDLGGMASGWSSLTEEMANAADALGLNGDAVRNYSRTVRRSADEFGTAELAQKTLEEQIQAQADLMARAAQTTRDYNDAMAARAEYVAEHGEPESWEEWTRGHQEWRASMDAANRATMLSSEEILKLGASLTGVNSIMTTLNHTMFTSSIAGAEMSQALIEQFGTFENFAQLSNRFYAQYYDETERAAKSQVQLNEALSTLGLTLPDTLAGYRSLVEGQDVTTEAGREAYAALLTLSNQFAELQASLTSFTEEQKAAFALYLEAERELAKARKEGGAEAYNETLLTVRERLALATKSTIDAEGALVSVREYNARLAQEIIDQAAAAGEELVSPGEYDARVAREAMEAAGEAARAAGELADAATDSQAAYDSIRERAREAAAAELQYTENRLAAQLAAAAVFDTLTTAEGELFDARQSVVDQNVLVTDSYVGLADALAGMVEPIEAVMTTIGELGVARLALSETTGLATAAENALASSRAAAATAAAAAAAAAQTSAANSRELIDAVKQGNLDMLVTLEDLLEEQTRTNLAPKQQTVPQNGDMNG